MRSLYFSIMVLISTSAISQNIMECSLQPGNGTEHLLVYLTDTNGVSGFNIKIGTAFDGNDLLSEHYVVGALPANAVMVENTFSVALDEMSSSPKYIWVKLMLAGGGFKEIKVTVD